MAAAPAEVGHAPPRSSGDRARRRSGQVLPCDEVCSALAWDAAHRTLYAGSDRGAVLLFRVPDARSVESDADVRVREEERFDAHADGACRRRCRRRRRGVFGALTSYAQFKAELPGRTRTRRLLKVLLLLYRRHW